jgi:diadenylate cyclase
VIEFFSSLIANLGFILDRLTWLDVLDLLLVTAVFFIILQLLKGTQAVVLLRGVFLLIILIGLLTSLEVLPAFSWLVQTTFPALLLAIPVIFAPEIRRALERIGRAGELLPVEKNPAAQDLVSTIVVACSRLADRQHGALIVIQRRDSLEEYIQTGVKLDSQVTPEILLQIFYPNTPLHDGAVIITGARVVAAACVMPLSSSGVLARSPDRQMGLRHRAALGISEASDAVAVVVSEETGSIAVVHGGRMIRRLDAERLENILRAFFRPSQPDRGISGMLRRLFKHSPREDQ